MITPTTNVSVMAFEKTKDATTGPRTLDGKELANKTVTTKVEKGTERAKEFLKDQVGISHNLTASYWG